MPDIREFIPGYEERRHFVETQSRLLLESHKALTGRDLLLVESKTTPEQIAHAVFFAPFVILSGGNETDQILNFANQKALELWEMSWDEITRTPSRLTAEPMHRDERARFLEKVRAEGFISDYQGIRISKNKRRFRIQKATVWNLTDPVLGNHLGQAATFAEVEYL